MSRTLRRDVRKTIEKVLTDWKIGADGPDIPALATEITDALYELPFFKKQDGPAFDKTQADPAWQLVFGDRSQADVDETKLRENALNEFERALALPSSFNWYPNRKAEEAFMATLRNLVVEEYKKDRTIFTQYETWRRQPYVRGAMSNATICSYPEKFVFSWSDFKATLSKPVDHSGRVEENEDGSTFTY